jgi:hypothetical protein
MKLIPSLICLATLLGPLAHQGYTELPPTVYRELQKEAPEVLEIKVTDVKSTKHAGDNLGTNWTETVTASVVKVVRSKSGCKVGDSVEIRYERLEPAPGWVGPSPAPQLTKGWEGPAFLTKSEDDSFSIAARGFSFQKFGE